MTQTREYRVTGRVQGVGYRWFCRKTADQLGVHGFARNLAGGTVQVVASAEIDVLEAFRLELERGPRHSRVDTVEVQLESSEVDVPERFEIR